MKRPVLLALLCLALPLSSGAVAVVPDLPLPVELKELPAPDAGGVVLAHGLARLGEGRVAASWLLRRPDGGVSVRQVVYDAVGGGWSPVREQLLQPGEDPGADAECTVLPLPDAQTEFRWQSPLKGPSPVLVSRVSAADGRFWTGPGPGGSGPAPLVFPDGTSLWVSRIRRPDGTVGAVSWRRGPEGSTGPAPLSSDSRGAWAASAGGLRAASLAPRVSVAWLAQAGGEDAVLLTQSPDAGLRWTQPLRCDQGRPVGPPDLAMSRDASVLLCWWEEAGDDESQPSGLYLRRYASNGSTTLPTLLRSARPAEGRSIPRIALLRDSPDSAPVVLILSAGDGGLRCLLAKLPSRDELLEADQGCQCAEPPGAWIQLRAEVRSIEPQHCRMVIRHGPVPGLCPASDRHEVSFPPGMTTPAPGLGWLLRVDRLQGEWRVLEARRLGSVSERSGAPRQ